MISIDDNSAANIAYELKRVDCENITILVNEKGLIVSAAHKDNSVGSTGMTCRVWCPNDGDLAPLVDEFWTIPKKIAMVWLRIANRGFHITKKHINLFADETNIKIPLIDSVVPYIPPKADEWVSVEKNPLAEAVKAVKWAAEDPKGTRSEKLSCVRVTFDGNSIEVNAMSGSTYCCYNISDDEYLDYPDCTMLFALSDAPILAEAKMKMVSFDFKGDTVKAFRHRSGFVDYEMRMLGILYPDMDEVISPRVKAIQESDTCIDRLDLISALTKLNDIVYTASPTTLKVDVAIEQSELVLKAGDQIKATVSVPLDTEQDPVSGTFRVSHMLDLARSLTQDTCRISVEPVLFGMSETTDQHECCGFITGIKGGA